MAGGRRKIAQTFCQLCRHCCRGVRPKSPGRKEDRSATPKWRVTPLQTAQEGRKPALLLALDVGNTNIVAGVYADARLIRYWRLPTRHDLTADHLAAQLHSLLALQGLSLGAISGMAAACVVPPLVPVLEGLAQQYLRVEPLLVGARTDTGIAIRYSRPHEVGADRIVNAAAAFSRYGGPAVVVDFGTATTVDALTAHGEYLGGAIAPGIGISVAALFREAAMLPRIDLLRPARAIGTDTVSSMQAGIVFGFAAQVDGLVERIIRELGSPAQVIATGGLAHLIASECRTITAVDPLLTLDGLQIIFSRNRG